MSMEKLYQEIVLKHFKEPRHYGPVSDEEALAEEENPTCGDHIRLTLKVEDGRVADIRFDGKGCAISIASSSLMTESVIGKPVDEVKRTLEGFIAAMKGERELDEGAFGDLVAMDGVRRFPLRIKCATLGWQALKKALARVEGADSENH